MKPGKIELNILARLRNDAREPLTRMSRKTGVPVSTLFDKVRASEGDYIIRNTCLINFERIGFNTRAKVMLKVQRDKREELRKYLSLSHNVNSLHKVNCGYDFMFELVFRNINELEDYMEDLRDRFGIIEEQTIYVLETIKQEAFMTDNMPLMTD